MRGPGKADLLRTLGIGGPWKISWRVKITRKRCRPEPNQVFIRSEIGKTEFAASVCLSCRYGPEGAQLEIICVLIHHRLHVREWQSLPIQIHREPGDASQCMHE